MRKYFRSALVCLSVLFLTVNCTSLLLKGAVAFERSKADVEKKSIQVGKFNFVYNEGGEGETVLFIHGFAVDKDNWTRLSAHITDRYHVVAPDLPGHGENDRLPDESYTVPEQVRRL